MNLCQLGFSLNFWICACEKIIFMIPTHEQIHKNVQNVSIFCHSDEKYEYIQVYIFENTDTVYMWNIACLSEFLLVTFDTF